MLTAICVIGKGDSYGIHARVYPLPTEPMSDRVSMGTGSQPFPVLVATAIRERWALLSVDVIPASAGMHVLKVSRHCDDQNHIWTWIGYYQSTEFEGEGRKGHYFGVGIAFCETQVSGDVGGFLDSQLDRLVAATFRGDRMVRSIFETDLRFDPREIAQRLTFERLREQVLGVNPQATTGVYQQEASWTASDVERMIRQSLFEPGLDHVGGCFFGNWPATPTGSKFYLADNEWAVRATPASRVALPAALTKPAVSEHTAYTKTRRDTHDIAENAEALEEYIVDRLESIDRKITDLVRQIQRMHVGSSTSTRSPILTNRTYLIIIALLSWLLLLSLSLSWRSVLRIFMALTS